MLLTASLRHRWIMTGLGALAGLSVWALNEAIDDRLLGERQAIFGLALVLGFFGALLAFAGQMRGPRALVSALVAAVPPAALMFWASGRHRQAYDFLDSLYGPFAALVLGLIPLPFLLVRADGRPWRDYAALFQQAWNLTIRFLTSLVFLGVVWILVYLSDSLLSLVGITLIGDLLRDDVTPALISGAAIGLSQAVIRDLAEVISPDLLIRLLRLLAPLVLAVTAVFLLALPVKGLSNLFDGLSSAAVLLAMAAVAATMVSLTIDQSDDRAASSTTLRQSAKGLALCILLLAGFGAWAIGLRIGQYGLSPDRIIALLAALVALGYGLGYAAALLKGQGWMEPIRQTNIVMALVMAGLAALTLSPLLNTEQLSANSQMRRAISMAEAGEVADLTALSRWGEPGQKALETLKSQATQQNLPLLAQAVETAMMDGAMIDYGPTPELRQDLRQILPVQPATEAALKDRLLDWLDDTTLMEVHQACDKPMAVGGPGCVLVVYDALPETAGAEALLIYRMPVGQVYIQGFVTRDQGATWRWSSPQVKGPAAWDRATGEPLIAQLQSRAPTLRPLTVNVLELGQTSIHFEPFD